MSTSACMMINYPPQGLCSGHVTYYFAPDWSVKFCTYRVCMSVYLSVNSHSSKTTCKNFTKFFANVMCGRGSVRLWQQCNMLRTSNFVYDVTFHIMVPVEQNQKTRLCFVEFARWQYRGWSCCLGCGLVKFLEISDNNLVFRNCSR